jgi:hypothetical protein
MKVCFIHMRKAPGVLEIQEHGNPIPDDLTYIRRTLRLHSVDALQNYATFPRL